MAHGRGLKRINALQLLMLWLTGCDRAAPDRLLAVEAQLAAGRPIYESSCATEACHGAQGEGIRQGDGFRAWPLVGEAFERRNPNAQVIFDVVRGGGEANLRKLTDQQVYAAIAYELLQNGVILTEMLTDGNAARQTTGSLGGATAPGELFPPVGNAQLLERGMEGFIFGSAENGLVRVRVDQAGLLGSIGNRSPEAGSAYLVLVVAIQARDGLSVAAENFHLETTGGENLKPLSLKLDFAVPALYSQTITPEHGTAGYLAFEIPEDQDALRLWYEGPAGELLAVELRE